MFTFYTKAANVYAANILTYSNSFVNPIVYALRIPEFRQAIRLCCCRRSSRVRIAKAVTEGKDNGAVILRTVTNDSGRMEMAVENGTIDTKL